MLKVVILTCSFLQLITSGVSFSDRFGATDRYNRRVVTNANSKINKSASVTAMSSSNIAVDENPYAQHTLEDFLEEVATKFQDVVKNGYPEKGIPVLDPLDLGDKSFPIKNSKVDVTFTLNDASITGFGGITLSSKPTVDFKENIIDLSFNIPELQISSEDYDREGTIKPLFKEYGVTNLDRALTITLSDIDINLPLDLDFSDISSPTLTIKDSSIKIGKLRTVLEDSTLFNLLAPLFKGRVADSLTEAMKKYLEPILSEKFKEACQKQMDYVEILADIYKERQRQGLLVDKDGNPMKPQILEGLGGVGQVAVPMFWQTPSVPVDKLDRREWNDIVKTAKTGDLLLCQGVARGSMIIRQWTQSPYSHVIMFVKEDKILDGRTVIVEASGTNLLDLLANKEQRGTTVFDPADWFKYYKSRWNVGEEGGAVVTFRPLIADETRSQEEHDKYVEQLKTFIENTNGIAYAEGTGMIELYIMGLAQIDLDKQESTDADRTFYCASYVAQLMMEFGIIERKFTSHQYSPRDFSQKYDTLPFIGSFDYGPSYMIDYTEDDEAIEEESQPTQSKV